MNDYDRLALLKQLLLQTPYAKEIDAKTHVRVRCPICGDSYKNPTDTHCYVNIEGGKPVSYYCFKCSEGHWVNANFIKALGIIHPELVKWIRKYNTAFLGKASLKIEKKIIAGKGKVRIPTCYSGKQVATKLRKFHSRMGVDLTENDCKRLKIILSLKAFLEENGLMPMCKDGMLEVLERKYLGFLSGDNSYIVFRNMVSDDYRYINYPVFRHSGDWGSKSYILPGSVDLMAEDIDLYMTEGVFDALGVYFHVTNRTWKNTLYASICGSGYMALVQRVLHMGFIGNLRLHIISDQDKSPMYYKNIVRTYGNRLKSIDVWYNQYPRQKDTGVKKELIDLKMVKNP